MHLGNNAEGKVKRMERPSWDGFAKALLKWHDENGRDLPWRHERDPYKIWLSEIMLQQTRAETVVGYYQRFLEHFPSVYALAQADIDEVLKLWEGLGYYSRARNVHKAAGVVVKEYGGKLPTQVKALKKLPGIGDYTAGAIASIAFEQPVAAVDGNVVRVVCRLFGIRENSAQPKIKKLIWEKAQSLVPSRRVGDFTQAMMGLGALVCMPRRAECADCPVNDYCDAYQVGDALSLPVLPPPVEKKVEEIGVALVFNRGRVLVGRREEKGLLGGLWQYPNFEDLPDEHSVAQFVQQMGINVQKIAKNLQAKHVFTHKIWQMQGFSIETDAREVPGWSFVTKRELDQLALPTAFKKYTQLAKELLAQFEGENGQ